MAAQLRVYPDSLEPNYLDNQEPSVRVSLSDLLPLLTLARRHNYLWLQDFLDDEMSPLEQPVVSIDALTQVTATVNLGRLSSLWGKFVSRIWNREPNLFYSNVYFTRGNQKSTDARTMAKEAVSATLQRKRA